MSEEYRFELDFSVRDYECDLQGIVNNAVYQNYLEHARHEFLKTQGLNFAQLHDQGCDLVIRRCEIDYLAPLRSGDRFVVKLNVERESRLRFAFTQSIFQHPTQTKILQARLIGTGLINGRPNLPKDLLTALDLPEKPNT